MPVLCEDKVELYRVEWNGGTVVEVLEIRRKEIVSKHGLSS